MKMELEDVKMISSTLIEIISPMLLRNNNQEADIIFDQDELAQYLKVSRSWVDQKISQNEIPHIKIGKYPRFRKCQIDHWLNDNSIPAIPPDSIIKMRK